MPRRPRRSDDSARKDRYVYRPPTPWFQRALEFASTPAVLGGLIGALAGLLAALFAFEAQISEFADGLQQIHIRFRPTGAVVRHSHGSMPEMQSAATRAYLTLGLLPIALGFGGSLAGRALAKPPIEEVFEQPR